MAPPFIIVPPVPLSLPQSGNILHHFDTTDISTLWQDAAGTMAVTSNGDDVKRIDNKGSSSEILTEEDVGQFPVWNAAAGAVDFLGPGKTLNNTSVSGGAPTAPMSVAFLGYEIVDWQSTSLIAGFWATFNNMGLRNNQAGSTSTSWEVHAFSTNSTDFTTLPTVLETPYSMVAWGNNDPEQKAWSSTEAAPISTTTAAVFPVDNQQFNMGANANNGANGIDGRMREIIVWDNYQLTDADVEEIKLYDTDKHGTVWAV